MPNHCCIITNLKYPKFSIKKTCNEDINCSIIFIDKGDEYNDRNEIHQSSL